MIILNMMTVWTTNFVESEHDFDFTTGKIQIYSI